MLESCASLWDRLRQERPLVHCISNYVTLNDVANAILASGASPAMVENPAESGDFAVLAGALYINLGTLTDEQFEAMLAMARAARGLKTPLVVDPVACGVIPRKVELYRQVLEEGRPSILKGNHAEIMSLAGIESRACGVDSLETGTGLDGSYQNLARQDSLVVVGTGSTDLVVDGSRQARLDHGSPLFAAITGSGCMLGGVIAACAAVQPDDQWLASATGLLAFSIAGELAAESSGPRPMAFRAQLIDSLYSLRGDDILQRGRISWNS